MKNRKHKLLFILITFGVNLNFSQQINPLITKDLKAQDQWVDSLYRSMSLDEKIGQLFMPMVFSKKDQSHFEESLKLITKHNIGGIIFSQGGPVKQSLWINAFQKASKTPLLIAMDAEWGVAMRLDSVIAFPWNMTLGAIQDVSLIRKIGKRMGMQEKRLGVHYSFAPVLDINTTSANPIIGNRSFGELQQGVTNSALAMMLGHHDAGILTSGKHFPGHGDTTQDSHKTLPVVPFSAERIKSVELYPYRKLIENGITSVMVGHLNVLSLTEKENLPTSLSKKVVTGLLKNEMGFDGLVVTDALNMKGVSKFSQGGNIDLAAFLAGHDMLLISENIPQGIRSIKKAYKKGQISEKRLAHSVKKILKAKYKVGLNRYKPIEIEGIYEDINTVQDTLLYGQAMGAALTLLKNENKLLPLSQKAKVAHIALGDADGSSFEKQINKYYKIPTFSAPDLKTLEKAVTDFDTLIVSFHRSDATPWKASNFNANEIATIRKLAASKKIILDLFVKPYSLIDLGNTEHIDAILMSYQNSTIAQELSADAIMGVQSVLGRLPVGVSESFPAGSGIDLIASKLGYARPSLLGFDEKKLKRIDSLAQVAIDSMMTPGMQILVARKGKVILEKSCGYHTYKKKTAVENDHLYDLASLTKILGTLPLVMQAVDHNDITLETDVQTLLPSWKKTNKSYITLKEMLSHYARLVSWIRSYKETLNRKGVPKRRLYRNKKSCRFSIPVTEGLFLKSNYEKKIYKAIAESPLLDTLEYRYSDLPYHLIKLYFEEKENQRLDELVYKHVFKPLNLKNMCYNPYKLRSMDVIVPSEIDDYFRHSELRGYVHDPTAAMQGGVGGHAGLFSNAYDIAVIMQMYLQGGFYNGKRIISEATLNQFNHCYYCNVDNRRGVGFDKPRLESQGSSCVCVSSLSFGHFGFTGTYAWADPGKEIVFVFLSNRTYPTMSNNLLGEHNIRTRIQHLVYDALVN